MTSRYCPAPLRQILVLAVPGDFQANLPIDALLGAPDNQLHTLWLTDPEATVKDPLSAFGNARPKFDCVFIAIAEDVRHRRALEAADRVAEALNVPVINQGRRIAAVSRSGAAQLLRGLSDAVVPSQTLIERTSLAEGAGLEFPVIVRPAGSHAGKVWRASTVCRHCEPIWRTSAGDRFYIAPFVDYRSSDGLWRSIASSSSMAARGPTIWPFIVIGPSGITTREWTLIRGSVMRKPVSWRISARFFRNRQCVHYGGSRRGSALTTSGSIAV